MFLISYGHISKSEIAYRTDVCLNLQGIIKHFSKFPGTFNTSFSNSDISVRFIFLLIFGDFSLYNAYHFMCVRWNLIRVLINISPMTH